MVMSKLENVAGKNVESSWTPQRHFNGSMLQRPWNTRVTNPCTPESKHSHTGGEFSVCASRTHKTLGTIEFKLQLQRGHGCSKPEIFYSIKPRNGMQYVFLHLNYWTSQRKYFLVFCAVSLSPSPPAPVLCSLVLICAEDVL